MARSSSIWSLWATRLGAGLLLATACSPVQAGEPGQPEVVQSLSDGLTPLQRALVRQRQAAMALAAAARGRAAQAVAEVEPAAGIGPLPILSAEPPPLPPSPQITPAPPNGPESLRRLPAKRATRVKLPPTPEGATPPPPTTLRRAPVVPPLTPEQAWTEQLYAVTLNGEPISDAAIFARENATGRLVVDLDEARRWRLRLFEDRVIQLNGRPFYPLDAIQGAAVETDEVDLTMAIRVPLGQVDKLVLSGDEAGERLVASAGFGGFFDYDVQYQAGEGLDGRLDGLMEAGLFGSKGVLTTSMLASDVLGSEGELVRLETSWTSDYPERHATLTVGDSLAVGGAFGRPFRFAGLQWMTNFGTDPSFITFPMPRIGGLADNPSVVDVFVDDLRRYTSDVPAGPFEIDQLPVITGAGELQVQVTDLLGRQQVVSQPYYVSTRLLRQGLSDYSYEAGFVRENYADESFGYGDPFASLTHRYGFSDKLTGEVHAEFSKDLQNLAAGGTVALGRFGTLSGGAGIGRGEDGEVGSFAQLDYEYFGRPFSIGFGTRLTSDAWRELSDGDDGVQPTRVDQVRMGLDLGSFGSLGLFLIHRDEREADDTLSATASWSAPVGPGSIVLTAAKLIEPDDEAAFYLNYVLPINRRDSASAGLSRDQRGFGADAQYHRSKGDSDLGADWTVGTRVGEDNRLYGTLGYDFSRLSTRLDADLRDGASAMRGSVAGSVALVDGKLDASRRLGRSFGMVDLPDMPDVRVYLENREVGRTDQSGQLLLPALLPYQKNRIRLEVADLPLDAQVGDPQVEAVPVDRGGMTVDFGIRRERQATVRLLDSHGAPLPGGLVLTSADGATEAQLGRDGFAHVRGLGKGDALLAVELPTGAIACPIPAVTGDDPLPDLGEVTCR